MENPNAALQEMRDLARRLPSDEFTYRDRNEKTARFCELFLELDHAIMQRGILPDAWDADNRRVYDYTKSA